MANIIPNEGELEALEAIRTGRLQGGELKLFKNDFNPVDGTILADFVEADFSGYAAITVNDWGAVFTDGAGTARTESTTKVFSHNGGGTSNSVYGYFFVANGKVMFAGRSDSAPVTMSSASHTFSVLPKYAAHNVPV